MLKELFNANLMNRFKFATFTLILSNVVIVPIALYAQGSLTPPGAPAPSMKSLEQIEPRTPISSLPFVISQPGSYYLTTNLTDTASTNGIIVQADDVTIDLCGFALSGSSVFTPYSSGVYTGFDLRNNLTVRNGTIRDWGFQGVRGGYLNNSHFENLRIYGNVEGGITVGHGCVIRRCVAQSNGGIAIYAAGDSVITDCASISNAGYGIEIAGGNGVVESCSTSFNQDIGIASGDCCTVRGCTTSDNWGAGILTERNSTVTDCTANTNGQTGLYQDGIYAGPYSTVSRCTVIGNTQDGIYVLDGSTVEDCTVGLNGTNGIKAGIGSTVRNCTVRGNGDDGIEVPNDCQVTGNHCTGNGNGSGTGAGIHTTIAGNHIEGNSAIYNQRGLWIEGVANLVTRNSSRYNPNGTGSNNFIIVSGNMVGPINSLASGFITNTSPWANFSY